LSDHGLTTVMNTPSTELNPGAVLLDAGVSESDVEWIANRGEWSFLALTDPSKSRHIESILEAYEVFDPVQRTMVKPYIVINREEMDSGVDGVVGRFAEDGVAGNRRGELYSAWTIDVPVTDNSKVRWPDLLLFTRNHFQTLLSDSTLGATSWVGSPFHGNHGSRRSAEVVLVASGPGIQPGVYAGAASLADIAPTLYRLLGVDPPANVDGRVLDEILAR